MTTTPLRLSSGSGHGPEHCSLSSIHPRAPHRLEESGGRRASRLRQPELPARGDDPVHQGEQRLDVATLVENVGREHDWKRIPGGMQRRVRVAPVHAERLGLRASLIESVERAKRERLGRVIGDEEIGAGSQRGDRRHAEAATKLEHPSALHDPWIARDLRRQGDPAWPELRPVRQVLFWIRRGVIDQPVIVDRT